jgi:carboxyl-terminal processing protease
MQAGDILLRIDGVETRGKSLTENVARMRGPVGSVARLSIERGGQVLEQELVREVIRVNTVRWETTPEGVLALSNWRVTYDTPEDLALAIEQAFSQGRQITGLILDLRANGGGPIRPVVGLAAAFLPPGAAVVSTAWQDPSRNERILAVPASYVDKERGGLDHLARLPPAVKSLPLVVIVNKDSRSGAELIAAALQDHKRARVVGEATAGLGLISTLTALEDQGALRLPSARMIRPSGQAIQAVIPDVKVDLSGWRSGARDDPALAAAIDALRR